MTIAKFLESVRHYMVVFDLLHYDIDTIQYYDFNDTIFIKATNGDCEIELTLPNRS
jgi:hypothetical protein